MTVILSTTLVLTGSATYYAVGLMEYVAEYREMDLSAFVGGVALNDPAHLGMTVWLEWEDGTVQGPFLVVDCAQRLHTPDRERQGYVVEVSAEVAIERGFYGWGPVPVTVFQERPGEKDRILHPHSRPIPL